MNNKLTLLHLDEQEQDQWNRDSQIDHYVKNLQDKALNMVHKIDNILIENGLEEYFDIFQLSAYNKDAYYSYMKLYNLYYYFHNAKTILRLYVVGETRPDIQDGLEIIIKKNDDKLQNIFTYSLVYNFPISWIDSHKEEFVEKLRQILDRIHEVYNEQ